MKSPSIRRVLEWLSRNPVLLLMAAVASVLSYFSELRAFAFQVFASIGIVNPIAASILLFLDLMLILIAVSYFVDVLFRGQKGAPIHHAETHSTAWQDGDGTRISEFRDLRANAMESILVVGIGMTFFSKDLAFMEELLRRGLHVRLLMINPDYVRSYPAKQFDKYFARHKYANDVLASHERLFSFIKKRKSLAKRSGSTELREYRDLIPMNATLVDESSKRLDRRMLLEWCFPYSDWRLAVRLSSKSNNEGLFEVARESIESIWEQSDRIIDDRL